MIVACQDISFPFTTLELNGELNSPPGILRLLEARQKLVNEVLFRVVYVCTKRLMLQHHFHATPSVAEAVHCNIRQIRR